MSTTKAAVSFRPVFARGAAWSLDILVAKQEPWDRKSRFRSRRPMRSVAQIVAQRNLRSARSADGGRAALAAQIAGLTAGQSTPRGRLGSRVFHRLQRRHVAPQATLTRSYSIVNGNVVS
jgi:hypothetical protein